MADAVALVGPDKRAIEALRIARATRETGGVVVGQAGGEPSSADPKVRALVIGALKRRLALEPLDAIGYVDLSREYAIAGQVAHAKRAMNTAVALQPDNRFVLRSAARLWSHLGDLERALYLLRRSNTLTTDPWLQAAEVAIADLHGVSSKINSRVISKLLAAEELGLRYSELAAALGSIEAKNGSIKRAKRLFARSLDSATENTVAQAEWVRQWYRLPDIDPGRGQALAAFEAEAMEAVRLGNYSVSDWFSWAWLEDEPFSVRAATHGSFINSALLRNHQRALEFANRGLVSNPDDHGLLNNKAVALIKLGRIEEATSLVPGPNSMSEDISKLPYDLALRGLFSFRIRNYDAGRDSYEKAILLSQKNDPKLAYHAALYWFEQEIISGQYSRSESLALIETFDAQVQKIRQRYPSQVQLWEVISKGLSERLLNSGDDKPSADQTAAKLSDSRMEHLLNPEGRTLPSPQNAEPDRDRIAL